MTFEEWLKETMLDNEQSWIIGLMRHAWEAGQFHAKPRLRTIDEAEKDGTPVLIWEDGEPLIVRYVKYNGLAAWRDWDMEPHNPTHCMLLLKAQAVSVRPGGDPGSHFDEVCAANNLQRM